MWQSFKIYSKDKLAALGSVLDNNTNTSTSNSNSTSANATESKEGHSQQEQKQNYDADPKTPRNPNNPNTAEHAARVRLLPSPVPISTKLLSKYCFF